MYLIINILSTFVECVHQYSLHALCVCVCVHPSQALLRGALCQQSTVILICMAVDRYMCALHPEKYHLHSSKKVSFNDTEKVNST